MPLWKDGLLSVPCRWRKQSESLNQLAVIRNQGGTITADQAAQQVQEQPSPEQGQTPQDTTSENTSSDGAVSSGQEGENSRPIRLRRTDFVPTFFPGGAGDIGRYCQPTTNSFSR